MDLIHLRKNINGICYNGNKYEVEATPLGVEYTAYLNAVTNATPDYGADQTKGYKVTFSVNSSLQFDIRQVLNPTVKLDYLPEYKFVLFWGEKSNIDTLTLVYDGDYLFHVEGTISFTGYHSSKTDVAGLSVYGIYLIDKDGNFFITTATTNPITSKKASSQTTINYTNPTLTFERDEILWGSVQKEITFPYDLKAVTPESEFTDAVPSFKVVGSSAGNINTIYKQKFL